MVVATFLLACSIKPVILSKRPSFSRIIFLLFFFIFIKIQNNKLKVKKKWEISGKIWGQVKRQEIVYSSEKIKR